MIPEPVTDPQRDTGYRSLTTYHLEKTLVKFLAKLTDTYALDNPAVNEMQPDIVTYDTTERAQTLVLKVPPRVVRGRVPRTVTGELDPNQLPDFPSIVVQAVEGKVEQAETHVTVRLFLHTYDENPDSQGYQDLTNMLEVVAYALTSFGQKGIDDAFPIILPLEWKIPDNNLFPHFIAEMITMWKLPSARPLPEPGECFIPAEHIHVGISEDPELEANLWNAS